MIYVLDTDVFSLGELENSPDYYRVHARILDRQPADKVVPSIVTYEEQTRGWLGFAAGNRSTEHLVRAYNRLQRHLLKYRNVEILPFDTAAANEFDPLRTAKIRIGTADLKIAAITLSRHGVLVTRNVRDFRKVPDLLIEDWTAA